MDTRLGSSLEGRYDIDREIGAGGMATVYLARDLRHKRNVALKVLNPELGAVLGVERFLAEIQVTANLSHPNLLPLFDSGEANGLLFYTMPFVEGESLRARLEREKQLPVGEAIHITCAIASALDYAHRHHVIHRDLKPENILMHEGQPLIADFGIALAVSNAGGARITQTGLSLGTPQYMSPEQATGDRVVDGRTDIYSLGAITYEMLVGDPPHVASTSQAIIAKLLTEKPASIRSRRPSVPEHVDYAIGRALEKLAADRFTTAKEFADALDGKSIVTGSTSYQAAAAPAKKKSVNIRELAGWAVAAAMLGVAGWQSTRKNESTAPTTIRTKLDLPPGIRINDAIVGNTIAVSPNGDAIALTSVSSSEYTMLVRKTDELEYRTIASGIAGRNLRFSPDGKWVAFTEGNVLKRASVDGGTIATIGATGSAVPYGLAWSSADTIYVGGFSGLFKIPASGGTATRFIEDSANMRMGKRWPMILPDGKSIAYVSAPTPAAPQRLGVIDQKGKITVYELPVGVPLGIVVDRLVYVSPVGNLMQVRWDSGKNEPIGDPVQIDSDVLYDLTSGAKASLSPSGTLAYLKGRAEFQPVLMTPGGSDTTALIREPGNYSTPRFSPDGRRLAIMVFNTTSADIWIYNLALNTFTRLTNGGYNIRPEWTADGKNILFVSSRGVDAAVYQQPADGSGQAKLLYKPEQEVFESIMSPDNNWLIYRTAPGVKFSRDIFAVSMTGDRTPVPLATGPETESMPRLSPDGKWLAYQTNESGRFEIYVRPFPNNGARIQVSDAGGSEPVWGRDGRTLYYRGIQENVIAVTVTTGNDFSIAERKTVLSGNYLTDSSHPNWDISPSGKLLMLKRAGAESQAIVIHNWTAELSRKTAQK